MRVEMDVGNIQIRFTNTNTYVLWIFWNKYGYGNWYVCIWIRFEAQYANYQPRQYKFVKTKSVIELEVLCTISTYLSIVDSSG
jgi:hypothetical protein